MPKLSSGQLFSTARAELFAVRSRERSKRTAPGKSWSMPQTVCSAVSLTRPFVGPWDLPLHPLKPRGTQSPAAALTRAQCAVNAAAYRRSLSLALGGVPARITVAVLLVIAHLPTPGRAESIPHCKNPY